MKYTAIATIVLLLLPIVSLGPLAVANQPPWNVELRVRPTWSNFTGPCVVSTAFPIDVYLWNDKSLTGVGVYAFDFKVSWLNTQGISLKSFANHIPWASGKFFLIVNETGTAGALSWYHLAVTAVGNSTLDPSLELGATGLFNASLVTLTFHIDSEPCWPGTRFTDFTIYEYVASTGCGQAIINWEIDNGHYYLVSKQPNIDPLVKAGDPGFVNASAFKEDSIGETHTIVIALSDITHAYGFWFVLTWDPLWYDTDIQHVTILPAFAPPYELLTMNMDPKAGTLEIQLMRPCEKPIIHAAGYTPVVEVTFVTTNTPMVGEIPVAVNTYFKITAAALYVKECQFPYYEYPTGTQGALKYSGDVIQMFVPKSRADITIDGAVDIEDLALLAEDYGLASPYANLAAPGGLVDIFDLVYVAKRYGDP